MGVTHFLLVIVINCNSSSTSSISPVMKSPGIAESIKALIDVVHGLKSAVESMDRRLESLEAILRPQVSYQATMWGIILTTVPLTTGTSTSMYSTEQASHPVSTTYTNPLLLCSRQHLLLKPATTFTNLVPNQFSSCPSQEPSQMEEPPNHTRAIPSSQQKLQSISDRKQPPTPD